MHNSSSKSSKTSNSSNSLNASDSSKFSLDSSILNTSLETSILENKILCPLEATCSGCQFLHLQYQEQLIQKRAELESLFRNRGLGFSEIKLASAGSAHLRDRLDFSLQGGRLGLYGKGLHDIVDIEVCAQLSLALQDWLGEFRTFQWPVQKGSVRLRVGPQGQKGVWLDFANIDIKKILEEKNLLDRLLKIAFVEIGQRRKVPYWDGSQYKLKDPELNIWFNTWMNEEPVNLYCHVASFTQPSLKANKLIANTIRSWVGQFANSRVIEFGSGIGNLTLPALFSASKLLACEIDALSLQGLQKTIENLPTSLAQHAHKLQIFRGDFQRKILQDFSQFDIILANPPRSGLMSFLDPLAKLEPTQRPPVFIYMSCFPESMATDLVKLKNYGYTMKHCVIVDQFPQSSHYEVLSLLQREEF